MPKFSCGKSFYKDKYSFFEAPHLFSGVEATQGPYLERAL